VLASEFLAAVSIASSIGAVIVAQASGAPQSIPSWVWAALGGLGAFLTTVFSGKIVVPTFAYLRERSRADAAEVEVARLNELIRTSTATALTESTVALRESSGALKDAAVELSRRRGTS
jgi:ABC-type branched-subunit amino acid transport system permease subunit